MQTVDLPACTDAAAAAQAVVVIDVLRACTTMATALARGAAEIVAVGTVAEARRLAGRLPSALLAGEIDGLPIAGFDLPNSPSRVAGADVEQRVIVQRTTAGTQGLVRCQQAPLLLAAGFVNASATAARLQAHAPERAVFVVTGSHSSDHGDEDRALADYLMARLGGRAAPAAAYLARVRDSAAAAKFAPDGPLREFHADVDHAATLDAFDFAVRARPGPDGYPVLTADRTRAPARSPAPHHGRPSAI